MSLKSEMDEYSESIPVMYPGYIGGCKKTSFYGWCGNFGSDGKFKNFERKCDKWERCCGERFRQAYIEPTLKKDGTT